MPTKAPRTKKSTLALKVTVVGIDSNHDKITQAAFEYREKHVCPDLEAKGLTVRLGALAESDRVVLIQGEIVPRMAVGPGHAACVQRTNRIMGRRAADRAVIGVQDPVRLPDSEPGPDVFLARPPEDAYRNRHPRPADLFLIIEIADNSLDGHRNLMRPLYAAAGVREYWIVNLIDEQLEIHRGPRPVGTYREARVLKRGERAEVEALPGLVVAVDELL